MVRICVAVSCDSHTAACCLRPVINVKRSSPPPVPDVVLVRVVFVAMLST